MMLDLYFYSSYHLAVMFLVSLVLFIMQASFIGVLIVNAVYKKIWVIISETLLIFYIALLTILPIYIQVNRNFAIIDSSYIEKWFYIIGFINLVHLLIRQWIKCDENLIFCIISVIITLPFMSFEIFNIYQIFYAFALTIFIFRAFSSLSYEIHRFRNDISAFSIKDGIDALPVGLMFCGTDGYIYLTNAKIQELMMRFFAREERNSLKFWDSLGKGEIYGGESQFLEGDILIRTPIDAWRFSRTAFEVNGSEYVEISAFDVTRNIKALTTLEEDRKTLVKQCTEIRNLSNKMNVLRSEQEYSRIRFQVHDIMSQRLTAMQRIMKSSNTDDYSELLDVLHDTMSQIKIKESRTTKEVFLELSSYFLRVGLAIEIRGDFPKEDSVAFLFLAVLRETCTNAIKHASATKVLAKIEILGDNYRIEITNNGKPPTKGIIQGAGIAGIKNRTERSGGILKVELMPEFAIVIFVSKDGHDVTMPYHN